MKPFHQESKHHSAAPKQLGYLRYDEQKCETCNKEGCEASICGSKGVPAYCKACGHGDHNRGKWHLVKKGEEPWEQPMEIIGLFTPKLRAKAMKEKEPKANLVNCKPPARSPAGKSSRPCGSATKSPLKTLAETKKTSREDTISQARKDEWDEAAKPIPKPASCNFKDNVPRSNAIDTIVTNFFEIKFNQKMPVILVWSVHEERQHTAKDGLLDILIQGRVCDATFPRDKVYGPLPMLQDATEAGLITDVARSPVQVFTETATWLVRNIGLGVLYSAGQPSELDNLPSWVPDWSIKMSASMGIGTSTDRNSERGRAGGILKPIASVHHSHELIARGVIFDKIFQGTSTSLGNRRGVAQLVANFAEEEI